ncbi:MAG: hypothetical protein ACI87W_001606 [Halieaceae bacterium]
MNTENPLIQRNSYFKLRSFFSPPALIESASYCLSGLIKHFSHREMLMNKVKKSSMNLLLPIVISSFLVGNVAAECYSDDDEPLSGFECGYDDDDDDDDDDDFYDDDDDDDEFYDDDDGPYSGDGPYAVELGRAGSFAILSKSGITDVYKSTIFGDVGTSPITGAALLLTCEEVEGNVYTVDAAGPLPCARSSASYLTVAVSDMEAAYVNAAGRSSPDFIELGAGEIGGLTLEPGLYKWSTGVTISSDVTFSGGPNDVWILQIAGTMNEAVSTRVTLAGGASAKNIFWQVAGATTIGTYAHFQGVVLSKTMVAVNTGASVNGRLLAQTAVTLQMNTVIAPTEYGYCSQ